MSIDVAFPGDRNVIKRETEKILKYKDLTIAIQRMWNVKGKSDSSNNCGRLEPFQNHFRQYLSNIPGKREIKELLKTTILCTAHTNCGKC